MVTTLYSSIRTLTLAAALILSSTTVAHAAQSSDRQPSDAQRRFDQAQQHDRIQQLESSIQRQRSRLSAPAVGDPYRSRTERSLTEQSLRQDRRTLREQRRDSVRPSPGRDINTRQTH